MKKIAMFCAVFCITMCSMAQTDSTEDRNLDEVIIYSNKFAEKKKNLAQKIDVITARRIAKLNSQNTGDLLLNTGNIFVQKSQQGGSSPVIRGFEASRVLLVVDGIRMNNAVYRAGHLQNVITVDQNMLEQVEVLHGPASTVYGSDGLGGVIHLRSKSPALSLTDSVKLAGTAFARYSSANNEKTAHVDLSIGGKKLAWLQSYTYSDFGDMKMGDNYTDKYPQFGRRSQYITMINGIDSVVTNDDDRVQRFSGYQQWDIMQKFLFQQSARVSHRLNFQYSNSSNIPRYDRLQDTRNFGGSIGTTLRYAEWFYGPQKRLLACYELSIKEPGPFDEIRLNVNHQNSKESRQQREYRRYDRFDSRREHVRVTGFLFDARKTWKNNELNLGIDGQFNNVTSVADRKNLVTGAITKLDSRYPDGENKMNYLGLYVQHLLKMKNGKLVLNDGIRFQSVNLHSTIIDNSFLSLPVTDIKQSPFAVTGNIGLIFLPTAAPRVSLNFSSGFRAPNIDDVARVFESSTATRRVIIPNPGIDPEHTYNVDLGISQNIKDKASFELTGFYTLFRNAIALAPFKLNGQDSIMYNGIRSAVYANQNVNKAFIRGFNARLAIFFGKKFTWENTVSQTFGRFKNPDGSKKPLDHVPPVFGKTSLTYSYKKAGVELYCLFNGWKKIADYNPDGEDNGQYATPEGMPSWLTLNWKANYVFTKQLMFQLGVENILDRNYRYFGSGFSAPGRNFIIALRFTL